MMIRVYNISFFLGPDRSVVRRKAKFLCQRLSLTIIGGDFKSFTQMVAQAHEVESPLFICEWFTMPLLTP